MLRAGPRADRVCGGGFPPEAWVLNAKENALRILRFERPERIVGGPPTHNCSYFGVNHEPLAGVGGHDSPIGTVWHDIWGVGWRKELDGVMGFAIEHPLADFTTPGVLERFAWPDPDDERLVGPIRERAAACPDRDATFLIGSHRETLWERCYNLVGMDRLMMAMVDAPAAVHELLTRVMDFQLGVAKHYLSVGVDFIGLGDDLGSQRAPLFSRRLLEEYFVPQYRRLVSLYKRRGVLINFHSCGNVEPIVDFFMDMGVDCLNPVQASANDLDAIRARTAGRMALQGGVSTHAIMTGPVEAIIAETRRRLWQLGRDGGYFCGPDQGMPFPEAHIAAMRETVQRYGVYPIAEPPEEELNVVH
ncbi:MAG: hypothetical protein BIFFINMI_00751 [Phycisphaerae bacterium]|nr:hypothetical protein [Phycisphaerae bacterium]